MSGVSLVVVGKIPLKHKIFLQHIMGYDKPIGKNRIWITKEEHDKLVNIDDNFAKDLLVRYNPHCRLKKVDDTKGDSEKGEKCFKVHVPNADGKVCGSELISFK
jgi:hypothetical protein